MFNGKRVIVVMPAYNAAKTLLDTHREVMAQGIVDLVIVVDDRSRDDTAQIARQLSNTIVHVHDFNRGYVGNQKTCYRLAIETGADIVVMVHPDYQYTPLLLPAMVSIIGNGLYSCVLGSRILGDPRAGGMPLWKYVANRFLTAFSNLMMRAKLSEYHTGYRAYSRQLLESLPFEHNSDDFIFDNQVLAQILWQGHTIAEVTCPTKYFAEASSINLRRSIKYGLGCVMTAINFRMAKWKLMSAKPFSPIGASPRSQADFIARSSA